MTVASLSLTPADLIRFQAIGVGPEMLDAAGIRRVDDQEARELLVQPRRPGDLAGLLIPYNDPLTGCTRGCRVRRDHPELENGKPKAKYLSAAGERRHLYFAPGVGDLLSAADVLVVVVESEKSVLSIHAAARRAGRRVLVVGIGGCWGWRGRIGKVETPDGGRVDENGVLPDFDKLRWSGRAAVLLFDANAASNRHVQQARMALADELARRGADVRIATLPAGEWNGPDDYCGTSGDDALFAVIDGAGSLTIDAGDGDLARVSELAIAAITIGNRPPVLFLHGGLPVRMERDERGAPVLRPLTNDRLRYHLARLARWEKHTRAGWVAAYPPMAVVRDLLAKPDLDLPPLVRIVEAPVFDRHGELCRVAGYAGAGSGLYYAPHPTLIDADLTPLDVNAACDVLLGELLGDFPFVGEEEVAHAVALLLLPFVRDLIDGPTPLHLIEKPTPGTGGTLLADALLWPALGRPVPVMTEGRDEDEWRKRITARLAASPTVVLIDNLRGRLDSAALSAAITAGVWEDRILGVSQTMRAPVRAAWVATGNNPAVSNEIARRTVRIRLDAKRDRPWLRSDFRHPDLREWMAAERPRLIAAALGLVSAWLQAGRPLATKRLGQFEQWAAVLGGILETAKIPGFLGNIEAFYGVADDESAPWIAGVAVWAEKYDAAPVGVAELFKLVGDDLPLDLGDKSERSQKTRLGKLIARMRDRVFNGYRIVAAEPGRGGVQRWRLEKAL